MNNKQKLGYALLGAGIMAIGITIGQFITPSIEAQNNGVFNEITCRELTVVDEKGNKAIKLASHSDIHTIMIGVDASESSILLGCFPWTNTISISNETGKRAIELDSEPDANGIYIFDPAVKKSFEFEAYSDRNELIVRNKSSGAGIGFYGDSNEVKQTRWRTPKED